MLNLRFALAFLIFLVATILPAHIFVSALPAPITAKRNPDGLLSVVKRGITDGTVGYFPYSNILSVVGNGSNDNAGNNNSVGVLNNSNIGINRNKIGG
ncbi:hypothetical protein G9A89_003378 [Geosiphon pyriformis]|nr:hypothetical protein G9A89_003378 [Geosiphon pyriformis]